ncbi:MAG: arsenosugar biosynthesis radical SAM protein ArsS [Mariprofundaceae bacterium]|nr:arsenosugar biosynthesis radical SAM protein ArsS [Mariprofundaceae bacterium]
MHDCRPLLENSDFPAIQRDVLTTLQVNLGYLCNQTCLHCHVDAGPRRTEIMSRDNVDLVIDFLQNSAVRTLDLTGGAPEMNGNFRYLVKAARALGIRVIDRCNLSILSEPGYEYLAVFLAENQVEISASLPCYLGDNVDAQRGKGIFDRSIQGIQRLNQLGYGVEGNQLILNLVYNPTGTSLPPSQVTLELAYKKELQERFDIVFNQLFTITNMPIKRFGSWLISKGEFEPYMQKLKDNYQVANLQGVMCRSLLSVDWQAYVYDCDFNQMLDLPFLSGLPNKGKTHLSELMQCNTEGLPIAIMDHCYGCTAGQGSSCGGAL